MHAFLTQFYTYFLARAEADLVGQPLSYVPVGPGAREFLRNRQPKAAFLGGHDPN